MNMETTIIANRRGLDDAAGSLLSVIICIGAYSWLRKKAMPLRAIG